MTPVGISKSTSPAVKNALAANACALLKPASSRKSVLIPQMNDAASVCSSQCVQQQQNQADPLDAPRLVVHGARRRSWPGAMRLLQAHQASPGGNLHSFGTTGHAELFE